jgi:hypothetical protein
MPGLRRAGVDVNRETPWNDIIARREPQCCTAVHHAISSEGRIMTNTRTLFIVAALGLSLAACNKGPNEQAGENADKAVEAATGTTYSGDGPRENVGEAMDKSAEQSKEQSADAMENQADAMRASGEKKADATENSADAVRDTTEKKADAMEDKADAVRK